MIPNDNQETVRKPRLALKTRNRIKGIKLQQSTVNYLDQPLTHMNILSTNETQPTLEIKPFLDQYSELTRPRALYSEFSATAKNKNRFGRNISVSSSIVSNNDDRAAGSAKIAIQMAKATY